MTGAVPPGIWLRLTGLRIGHPGRVLPPVPDLALAEDEPFLGVVGASGVGKTTLLLTLAGQIPALSGDIVVNGASGASGDARPVVFQASCLMPWLTAAGNVSFALRCRGVPRRDRRELAAAWLARFGLAGAADLRVDQLSGGMAQRVNLARAFAREAAVILMDEPFSALDEATRDEVEAVVFAMLSAEGRRCVLVSHDLDAVVGRCQVVLALRANGPAVVLRPRECGPTAARAGLRGLLGG